MYRWVEPVECDIPEEIIKYVEQPIVAQALVNRGIDSLERVKAFLNPDFYSPASPTDFPDMERAIARLLQALRHRERILVWGDFDVDGQTATALLVSALRMLGADVIYHVPIRAEESHGVNVQNLKKILNRSKSRVGLVLTCDTGINSHEAVQFAQAQSVDVIVTDHHQLPESLPQAYAVISSCLLPPYHSMRYLSGVGVAYKLVQQLFEEMKSVVDADQFLDLVALGTVADVAILKGEVRYLLQRGLPRLRSSKRVGLQMIYEQAELAVDRISEEHIRFILAPRLNAVGRLGDANPAVELLITDDRVQARVVAVQLEGLNSQRQLLTNQVWRGALAQLEQDPSLMNSPLIFLSHPSWPAGVLGIVASRLVDRFNKPAVLISTPVGKLGRGSARSIEGIDITAAIEVQKDLLVSFGGHPMAAGFSIAQEEIPNFKRGLTDSLQKMGGWGEKKILIDGYLPLSHLSNTFVESVEKLAPFGIGNPPLVFVCKGLRIVKTQQVGRNQEHLLLKVEDDQGASHEVIWWQGSSYLDSVNLPEDVFDLAYIVRSSTYRGQLQNQVELIDFRQGGEDETISLIRREIEIIDRRQEALPLASLIETVAFEEIQIWAEADSGKKLSETMRSRDFSGIKICNRYELQPSSTLVIWTIPPARSLLKEVIDRVQPRKVILFGNDPNLDERNAFLERLAGLLKFAVRKNHGIVEIKKLAALMAHRESTIRKALEWFGGRKYINILKVDEKEGVIQLASKLEITLVDEHFCDQVLNELSILLDEAAAFRAYYQRAEKNLLIS